MVPVLSLHFYDPVNTGVSITASPMPFPSLSQGQASAALRDPFMPSKLESPVKLEH